MISAIQFIPIALFLLAKANCIKIWDFGDDSKDCVERIPINIERQFRIEVYPFKRFYRKEFCEDIDGTTIELNEASLKCNRSNQSRTFEIDCK